MNDGPTTRPMSFRMECDPNNTRRVFIEGGWPDETFISDALIGALAPGDRIRFTGDASVRIEVDNGGALYAVVYREAGGSTFLRKISSFYEPRETP